MGLDEALQDTDFRNNETGVFQAAGAAWMERASTCNTQKFSERIGLVRSVDWGGGWQGLVVRQPREAESNRRQNWRKDAYLKWKYLYFCAQQELLI